MSKEHLEIYSYVEDPTKRLKGTFIPLDLFHIFVDSFVGLCVDAVLVNMKRQTFFLAKRKINPGQGWWWIGGRIFAGDEISDAMVRSFKRETGLLVEADRFKLIELRRYMWKDRGIKNREELGRDDLVFTHILEATDEEIVLISSNLNKEEYEPEIGLQEFNRERLLAENVRKPVLDFYDLIFG